MHTTLPETLPIQRFRLLARVTRTLELPEFSGSMLRGAFGQVLRGSPLYPIVFEPKPPEQGEAARYASSPPPYLIEPPPPGVRRLAIGDPLEFGLVLMGPALKHLPAILSAWATALEEPLGHFQGAASLVRVTDERGRTIFDSGRMLLPDEDYRVDIAPAPPELAGVTLDFQTPLCLRHKGKYLGVRDLDATQVLRAIVRRVVTACTFSMGTPLEPDYAKLFGHIDEIRLASQMRRVVWARYSSRQEQKMPLGGLLGRCRLDGPLQTLWPCLVLGQWLHVGKETVFGLGHYRMLPHSA